MKITFCYNQVKTSLIRERLYITSNRVYEKAVVIKKQPKKTCKVWRCDDARPFLFLLPKHLCYQCRWRIKQINLMKFLVRFPFNFAKNNKMRKLPSPRLTAKGQVEFLVHAEHSNFYNFFIFFLQC